MRLRINHTSNYMHYKTGYVITQVIQYYVFIAYFLWYFNILQVISTIYCTNETHIGLITKLSNITHTQYVMGILKRELDIRTYVYVLNFIEPSKILPIS